jgi:hypothetical protein
MSVTYTNLVTGEVTTPPPLPLFDQRSLAGGNAAAAAAVQREVTAALIAAQVPIVPMPAAPATTALAPSEVVQVLDKLKAASMPVKVGAGVGIAALGYFLFGRKKA